ncbi:Pentapeptide repeat-containing protein [Streptomyces sp. Ag82_O1-12]|uniref:pentapeptide repeat-containing protein n=1 Tax=unclassified Streptomyces TaxID=2593676 RepID=UPI000BC79722|nr:MULTISPECIES: pentapeptide repeat-containing protein [unclassified Streptomyces]SMQ17520.1 Pentapeptide repeat-containing protein [Streptomyces sp. Ag82_O1-12]SOD46555.1 Pentapeptide repeat-containing protein [Streptomyces sp. Ag82_G6-1]
MSTSEPPAWPHCAHGADPSADPVGCRGIHVPGHTECLAHLADADRDAYLASLSPGASIDHRGTTFTDALLTALLNALRNPATGNARLGTTWFKSATFAGSAGFDSMIFAGDASFDSATFGGNASFGSAIFEGDASFGSAIFEGDASFESATFKDDTWFGSATFKRDGWFASATFKGNAGFESATIRQLAGFESAIFERSAGFEWVTFESGALFESVTFRGSAFFSAATFKDTAEFESATFRGGARFDSATFDSDAGFESATFEGDAWFASTTFVAADQFGPLVCAGRVVLSGARFGGPVTLALAARRLECRRTRWTSTAEIRLRFATVDFAHAVFEYPLTIATEPDPFVLTTGQQLTEDLLSSTPDPGVRVASLRGVDAAHLVLADLNLSGCLFAGTVHLDQLRLEGACAFDTTPPAVHWRRWPPVRFTARRVLAEEHHWRASQPRAVRGWNTAILGAGRTGPLQLAPVYRALRKAFEDGKHEPGAADFYYGEMEMRRHADDIPRSERGLLTAYWALSGYGLRASRALAWLGVAMLLTIVLLMAFGIAKDTPKQTATGTVPAGGGKVTFEIDKDDPQNPTGNRFTGKCFEKALNVTLNSVVFRSSGQDLTTAGTYIEMTSRLTEPVLLGLAVLAIRNRVKR